LIDKTKEKEKENEKRKRDKDDKVDEEKGMLLSAFLSLSYS
jgi:hypothetical protein